MDRYPPIEINSNLFGRDSHDWYTLYATCCKSLDPNFDKTAAHAGLIEVAVHPNLLSNNRDCQTTIHRSMESLPRILHFANEPIADYKRIGEWHDVVLSVCTGTLMTSKQCPERSDEFEPRFGVYKNGVFVIMDLLLRPSTRPESTNRCQIQFEQPLQIPVNEDDFVIAESSLIYASEAKIIEVSDLPKANVISSHPSDIKIGIDLEPSWESDPRCVRFRARINEILACSFSPEYLITPLIRPPQLH